MQSDKQKEAKDAGADLSDRGYHWKIKGGWLIFRQLLPRRYDKEVGKLGQVLEEKLMRNQKPE